MCLSEAYEAISKELEMDSRTYDEVVNDVYADRWVKTIEMSWNLCISTKHGNL